VVRVKPHESVRTQPRCCFAIVQQNSLGAPAFSSGANISGEVAQDVRCTRVTFPRTRSAAMKLQRRDADLVLRVKLAISRCDSTAMQPFIEQWLVRRNCWRQARR